VIFLSKPTFLVKKSNHSSDEFRFKPRKKNSAAIEKQWQLNDTPFFICMKEQKTK
jgi:hypothetical protein